MNATTVTTTPTFSSLIEELNPWAEGHPYAALCPALRHLHSTLEVLHEYTANNLIASRDPIEVRIIDVLESVTVMTSNLCDHSEHLESKLIKASKSIRVLAGQFGEEVQHDY